WMVTDRTGDLVEKSVNTVEWNAEEIGKSGFNHFMLKEIHEQPRALRQCLRDRVNELGGAVEVPEITGLDPTMMQFAACGTCYHAALYGAQLFRAAGVPAQTFLASEYMTSVPPIG